MHVCTADKHIVLSSTPVAAWVSVFGEALFVFALAQSALVRYENCRELSSFDEAKDK